MFHVNVRAQANLDFKFLNDRFMKGKQAVDDFMDQTHRLASFSNLVLAHSLIVQKQAELGSNGLRGRIWFDRFVASGVF